MRKSFFLIAFIMIAVFCHSQNGTFAKSFVIHGNTDEQKKAFFIKSIEAADFEQYRLKTETVTLKFKNGFLLELMPAKELMVKGIVKNIDINKYSDQKSNLNYKLPVFEILDSGWITAEIQNNSK